MASTASGDSNEVPLAVTHIFFALVAWNRVVFSPPTVGVGTKIRISLISDPGADC